MVEGKITGAEKMKGDREEDKEDAEKKQWRKSEGKTKLQT